MLLLITRILDDFEEMTDVDPQIIDEIGKELRDVLEAVFDRDLPLREFIVELFKPKEISLKDFVRCSNKYLGTKIRLETIPQV